MTKKDYIKVAAVLHGRRAVIGANIAKEGLPSDEAVGRLLELRGIENDLIEIFQADNPLFDRQRFLLASGGDFKK